jgi:hypothetical protein
MYVLAFYVPTKSFHKIYRFHCCSSRPASEAREKMVVSASMFRFGDGLGVLLLALLQ